ncbi:TPR repeat protein [Marinobacter santoriniensis NKSG1]|uniref:TPR repeat protein n=1 Tax=Marinobacter santoriniensis NKSG1 TaxID=1288826 RepID=M7CQU3_9GAMM|nr:tetratricopeptide repeat protein [Marinobacter santoriniensis]EMP55544.1 TPR repeat protein [Marinobacter santoriniensis NKSG1]
MVHRFRPSWLSGLLVLLWLTGCAGPSVTPEAHPKPEPDPVKAAELAEQGKAAWDSGEADQAIEDWTQAVRLNPADATTINNLALALADRHDYEAAADFLKQGIAESPGVPELHYNLAVISELYLLDLKTALSQYRAYEALSTEEDADVAGWIADLKRRLEE